jgi:hypothetical protein
VIHDLKLSRQRNSGFTLMMGTEMVPETSVLSFNYFTWLIAEEDFIETILIYNIVA